MITIGCIVLAILATFVGGIYLGIHLACKSLHTVLPPEWFKGKINR